MLFKNNLILHATLNIQIKSLKKRNLIISNESEVKHFLSKYSYNKLIGYYSEPFFKHFNKNTNRYDYNSSFKSIVELFLYDNKLSSIVFDSVKEIEKEFISKIILFISKKLLGMNKKDGEILGLDLESLKLIFDIKSKDEIYEIMTKYLNDSYYGNINQIPIWDLSNSWTFGTSIKIFNLLNKEIKYKIIRTYYWINCTIPQFTKIMEIFNKIRNIAAHNLNMYNIKIKLNNSILFSFIRKNFKNEINCKEFLRIYDILKIIDKFNRSNNSI